DLDREAPLGESVLFQRLGGHLVPRLEAGVDVREGHRLGGGPGRLERHRHLLVRAAQLAHPHVDGVLAALVADLALVAGALARALVPATGGLAVAGADTAAEALSRPPRPLGRLQGVEADVLSHS